MEPKVYKQVIRKVYPSPIQLARVYYSMLCSIGNIHLSKRQLDLLAYIAVRGTISSVSAREDFCKQFNSSKQTINNIVSELKEIGLLVKENGKIKVKPSIALDFTNDVHLNISLQNGQ
jgi:predicted heme/steroid binding protein